MARRRVYLAIVFYFTVAIALVAAELWFAYTVVRDRDWGGFIWVIVFFSAYWAWRSWVGPRLMVPLAGRAGRRGF